MQHALDGGRRHQCHRHHQVTRCIYRFRGSPGDHRSTEDNIQPHSIPHYAGVLSPHRGRHLPCPKNDKAGNTSNASLRKHQARSKNRAGYRQKYRSSVRYTGRYCQSDSYPTHGQIHCVPNSTVFNLAQYGGWQRAANRHLHRDTTRRQNRTAIFRPYSDGTGTFL